MPTCNYLRKKPSNILTVYVTTLKWEGTRYLVTCISWLLYENIECLYWDPSAESCIHYLNIHTTLFNKTIMVTKSVEFSTVSAEKTIVWNKNRKSVLFDIYRLPRNALPEKKTNKKIFIDTLYCVILHN